MDQEDMEHEQTEPDTTVGPVPDVVPSSGDNMVTTSSQENEAEAGARARAKVAKVTSWGHADAAEGREGALTWPGTPCCGASRVRARAWGSPCTAAARN